MSVVVWSTLGTIIGTLVLVVVPGLVYSWLVLEEWIGDRYPEV